MIGGLALSYQNVLQIYSNQNNMALMLSSNSDFFFSYHNSVYLAVITFCGYISSLSLQASLYSTW